MAILPLCLVVMCVVMLLFCYDKGPGMTEYCDIQGKKSPTKAIAASRHMWLIVMIDYQPNFERLRWIVTSESLLDGLQHPLLFCFIVECDNQPNNTVKCQKPSVKATKHGR